MDIVEKVVSPNCKSHDSEYKGICIICNVPVCYECAFELHNGHTLGKFNKGKDDELFQTYLDQYNSSIQIIQSIERETKQKIKNNQISKQDANRHFDIQIDKVKKQFHQMHIFLQELEENYLNRELNKMKQSKNQYLDENIANLTSIVSELEQFTDFHTKTISKLDGDRLFNDYKYHIIQQISSIKQTLESIEIKNNFQPTNTVSIVPQIQMNLEGFEQFKEISNNICNLVSPRFLYIVGGVVGDPKFPESHINTITRVNLVDNTFEKLQPTSPHFISYIKTSTVLVPKNENYNPEGDLIFTFGGENTSMDASCYNVHSDNWAEPWVCIAGFGSNNTAIYDGDQYIYIFGGYQVGSEQKENLENMKKVRRFNLQDSTIDSDYATMNKFKYFASACIDKDRKNIYLVGGSNEKKKEETDILKFNLMEKKFER
eukprot:gene4031-5045_t